MKRVLLTWIGFADFVKDKNTVSEQSPILNFHQLNKDTYDIHILLTTAEENHSNNDWVKALLLRSRLTKDFRNIQFNLIGCNINAFDLQSVYATSEKVLNEYSTDKVDIIFSLGTSIMSVAWSMLHAEKGINTTLIQGIAPKFGSTEPPKFIPVYINRLNPGAINIDYGLKKDQKYKLTDSIIKIYEQAKIIAGYDKITTLIIGDSGSGKEHLAKYIYHQSSRSHKVFMPVNCSSLSDDLLESRLFGHLKGSFTGAANEQTGFFESANGGVLFLDEIGDISPRMQQSLLRVLQEGKIIKMGDTKELDIDVRIIAATNKNLEDEIEKGNFRRDLYYRLIETVLTIPSLKERGYDELKDLINFFIEKNEAELNKKLRFSAKTIDLLAAYNYPGNVRQLQSIIKNIFIFNNHKADEHYIQKLLSSKINISFNLKEAQNRHVLKTYNYFNQKKMKTAEALGITINTMNKYLNILGIEQNQIE